MMWGDTFFWPFGVGLFAIRLLLSLIIIALVVWMIVDCVNRKFNSQSEKIVWVILMVLTMWVGALIYYIVIKSLNPRGISKNDKKK